MNLGLYMSREPIFKSNEHFTETFLGKPISNLEIKLLLHDRTITIPGDEHILENLGLAYHYAKKYLEGKKHITTKDQILPDYKNNLLLKRAILDVDKQVSDIIAIGKLLGREIKDTRIKGTNQRPVLHVNYDGFTHYIKVKNKGLYLE